MIIEIPGHVLDVEWNHQKFEPETLEYPGCPESMEVDGAYVDGVDVFKTLPESVKDSISEILWGIVNDDR
jgi:hypothetical protein